MKWITKLIGAPVTILLALVALVGLPASPTSAGGWVVVSLDERPQFRAGEPTDVGFTVLRHGVTPESSDVMQVVVTAGDGTQERFAVTAEGDEGHHIATVTLGAGTYTWALHGAFMPYELGTVEVGAASGVWWGWDVARWGGLGAAVVLGGLAAGEARRGRRRRRVPAAA